MMGLSFGALENLRPGPFLHAGQAGPVALPKLSPGGGKEGLTKNSGLIDFCREADCI